MPSFRIIVNCVWSVCEATQFFPSQAGNCVGYTVFYGKYNGKNDAWGFSLISLCVSVFDRYILRMIYILGSV